MIPAPSPRPPVMLGYRLHHEPGSGPTADRDTDLALAREPGHVLALVRVEGEHRGQCLRCLATFTTAPIGDELRGLVPFDSECTYAIRGRVVDHDRVILTVLCPVCETRQQAAPDGAMRNHRMATPFESCGPLGPVEPMHLAVNRALSAARTELADYYPRGDETLGAPAARQLVEHAAQIAATVALADAQGLVTIADDGTVTDVVDDREQLISNLLVLVRANVEPIITARRCHTAAQQGSGAVAELVDVALVLAVRLVVDPTSIQTTGKAHR